MRRLIRILLNAATVLSFVLCVATIVLWARSYCVYDSYDDSRFRSTESGAAWIRQTHIYLGGGGFRCYIYDSLIRIPSEVTRRRAMPPQTRRMIGEQTPDGSTVKQAPAPGNSLAAVLGFEFDREYQRYTRLTFQLWHVVLLTAILPYLWWYRRRHPRRLTVGLCRNCGYDLRATPDDQSRYPLNYASRFTADRGDGSDPPAVGPHVCAGRPPGPIA